ncbi:Formin-like protein 11 [Bienertia sinuspersici]
MPLNQIFLHTNVRANDIYDGVEEGYDSSRDEVLSVSSYNPSRDSLHKAFGSSLSLQGSASRSFREPLHAEADEVIHNSSVGEQSCCYPSSNRLFFFLILQIQCSLLPDILPTKSPVAVSPRGYSKTFSKDEAERIASSPIGTTETVKAFFAAEGYLRGRSYNIKLDDQVLLRFSPKKSDSNYYFSDMIGGTLTFFHEEGARRCLEVNNFFSKYYHCKRRLLYCLSGLNHLGDFRNYKPTICSCISKELPYTYKGETFFLRQLRKNKATLFYVHCDHHEVVADLVQTSFLFSVPMDGPMSFSTPHVSVQWTLRFEFFTTPNNIDWSRFGHPLLVEGRDKCEWSLPITVYAPPPGAAAAHAKSRKNLSLEPVWI